MTRVDSLPDDPTVSVIITTHAWDRYGAFRDALRSVEAQTYDDIEIVAPVDGDPDLATATTAIADGGIVTAADPNGTGLAAARNRGAELASGDVYAFLDDDAMAHPEWVARLVDAYRDGELAAGGPAHPVWPSGSRPWYLPRRFDWLVGAGPYHDDEREVRNTYGCNLSFRADAFEALGGFDETLGKGAAITQGEESDLCRRLREQFGTGVRYIPEASVKHRVFPEQLTVRHLLRRAYEQGQTKRAIGVDDGETSELAAIVRSALSSAPHRSLAMLAYTTATGAGYIAGPKRTPG